ncbi:hypothetical protein MMC22_005368 [Lobaria immixta]|nr:hypothetical protein [Lobaria immixta]
MNPASPSSEGSARREARARRERRISVAKKQVENLRGQVTSSRLELRELRAELRQRHVNVRHMQARFWRGLQNQWNNNRTPDQSTLQQLYEDIQKTLDELGPEESNYDEKEDDLDVLDYKLGKLEDRFYDTDADLAGSRAAFASTSGSSSGRSRSITPTRPEDETSWNYRYLSRVGDANIVRERLEELSIEKSQYIDLERQRAALDLDPYKPNVEFLDTFEEVYAKNEFDLREIEEDLERLQNELRPTPPAAAKVFVETIDLQQPRSLEHEAPKTMSHGNTLRRKSDGDLLNVQVDTLTVRQRVNQWIFESLNVSSLERARHRHMLPNPNLDNHTWRSLVLDSWQSDQAALSSPSNRRRSSKYPRSVSSPIKAFSHSTQRIPKLDEKDIGNDAMDYTLGMGDLMWDTVSKSPWKTSVNGHGMYESTSPRSLVKKNDYPSLDGCEIYSL